MIYDRPYMKSFSKQSFRESSIVFKLIGINLVIFVLQRLFEVLFNQNTLFADLFALSGMHIIQGKLWTLLSYSFLHSSDFIHILGNMIGLYFIGKAIEPLLGSKQFLLLYLASAFTGALFYLSLNYAAVGLLVGASAAVSGLLAFYCLEKPNDRITLLLFFIIPISIQPKWLLKIYAIVSLFLLLTAELTNTTNIAHSAHLGGLLFGFIYFRFFYASGNPFLSQFNEPSIELPKWFKRQQKSKQSFSYSVHKTTTESVLKAEMNKVLDKINAHGFDSLTKEEREILNKASKLN